MTGISRIKERITSWKSHSYNIPSRMNNDFNNSCCNKKILVDTYGLNSHVKNFYLVHRESEHTAVISEVKKQIKANVPGQSGWEMLDINDSNKVQDFQLAEKSSINDETYYHFKNQSLMEWQGNPLDFNFSD